MDEEELRKCLKIHGYVSSTEEEESDSDSSVELDERYEAYRPPPIQIDPKIHKIIEIGACKKKKLDMSVSVSNSNTVGKGITKKRRKRKRKKVKKAEAESKLCDNTTTCDNFVPLEITENRLKATRWNEYMKFFGIMNSIWIIITENQVQKFSRRQHNQCTLKEMTQNVETQSSLTDENDYVCLGPSTSNELSYIPNYPEFHKFREIDNILENSVVTCSGCLEENFVQMINGNCSGLASTDSVPKLSKTKKRRLRRKKAAQKNWDLENTERTKNKEIANFGYNWELVEEVKENTERNLKEAGWGHHFSFAVLSLSALGFCFYHLIKQRK